jgi:hypothetical protein
VQPGHIDTEPVDRRSADRPDDGVGVLRDRVQCPPEPVVTESGRGDPVNLRHRPRPRPVSDSGHRGRVRQPVRDQNLDDLAMRRESDITDRAQLIDNPGNVDPAAEIRDHRQRSQPFLQHSDLDQLGTRTHSTTPQSMCEVQV